MINSDAKSNSKFFPTLLPVFVDTNKYVPDSPCHANATCNNTEISHIRTFNSGYFAYGFTCYCKKIMHKINIRNVTTTNVSSCNDKKCTSMMKIRIATTTNHASLDNA
jgi:hypothetical protein